MKFFEQWIFIVRDPRFQLKSFISTNYSILLAPLGENIQKHNFWLNIIMGFKENCFSRDQDREWKKEQKSQINFINRFFIWLSVFIVILILTSSTPTATTNHCEEDESCNWEVSNRRVNLMWFEIRVCSWMRLFRIIYFWHLWLALDDLIRWNLIEVI